MNKEYLLLLSYFDKLNPKFFNNKDITPEMSAYGIGYGETYNYDYSKIIHQLSTNRFLRQVHKNTNPGGRLQPFTANTFKGYILTKKGVNALVEREDQKSKQVTSKEVAITIVLIIIVVAILMYLLNLIFVFAN
jgi:hypothetical protein